VKASRKRPFTSIVSHLRNRKAKAILKVLLSGLILLWLFRSVHLSKIRFAVSDANVALLALAVVCQAASNLIAGLRWYLTMKILEIEEPSVFFVKSFFKGTFLARFSREASAGTESGCWTCEPVRAASLTLSKV
jgi:uncharacterized membrane protein YbhN (UPF0104 family)